MRLDRVLSIAATRLERVLSESKSDGHRGAANASRDKTGRYDTPVRLCLCVIK